MNFNLNEFLSSVANVLDAIEIDIFGMPTNHSKRIAYMSVKMGMNFNLNNEDIFDLAALAIMHDNGASMKILQDSLRGTTKEKINLMESKKEHCIIGDDNLKNFPFFSNHQNVIKYHHEKYDGSGFFGLVGDEIPIFSQIIALSDTLDLNFDLTSNMSRESVFTFLTEHKGIYFSVELTDLFLKIADENEFWEGMSDGTIDESLKLIVPLFEHELNYTEVRAITKTFSKIIDAKSEFTQMHSSGLSDKLELMAKFYKIDEMTTLKLLISTDLHDLGKLVISNAILDLPRQLTNEEFDEIKKHPTVTEYCLRGIKGFEEITNWASNHHEKLNGSGYPKGLTDEDLDFNSRLVACLDIYQALREDRPYRKAMNHLESMEILNDMVKAEQLDATIVSDINIVFRNT